MEDQISIEVQLPEKTAWTVLQASAGGHVGDIYIDYSDGTARYNPICRSSVFTSKQLRQLADFMDRIKR